MRNYGTVSANWGYEFYNQPIHVQFFEPRARSFNIMNPGRSFNITLMLFKNK